MATNTHSVAQASRDHPENGDTNFSTKLKHLNISSDDRVTEEPSQRRCDEDADRRHSYNEHRSSRSIDIFDYSLPESSPVASERQNHSEDVADRNMSTSTHPSQSETSTGFIDNHLGQNHQHSPANKGIRPPNRVDIEQQQKVVSSLHRSNVTDPDLPEKPTLAMSTPAMQSLSGNRQPQGSSKESSHPAIDESTKNKLTSIGIDLENVTDTLQHTHLAPAVTHETVQPVVHEVRHEEITREIHNVDIYHRILPVKEVEILPARHFIRSPSGTLIEVPEAMVPELLGLT